MWRNLLFLIFFLSFAKLSGAEPLQFYAYSEDCTDHFNEACILCTPSKEYAATIAFTKHWKITYWINSRLWRPV